MTTHSPLPWTRHVSFDSWFVDDAVGEAITIFGRTKTVAETPEPGVRITRDVPRPHADANCQLFFAAPALLAQARELYSWAVDAFGPEGTPIPDDHPVAKMAAVIALATTVKDGTVAAAEHQAERDKAINDAFAEPPKE